MKKNVFRTKLKVGMISGNYCNGNYDLHFGNLVEDCKQSNLF